ncbi:MAG: T9SS type A sorting domain-containing protein [Ignavibacteria bacterium]|nr:T9SS type A sorting domain-containing protein [Ignavibacteria bacterium]
MDIDTLNNLYISKLVYIYQPFLFSYANIYRSTNFGQNWNLILTTGSLLYCQFCFYISLFNIPRGDLFASLIDPIETQHYLNGTTKVYPITAVSSAHITAQGDIFLTTPSCCVNQGIHISVNDGLTWKSENSGLSSLATSSIVSDTLGYLYTSTGYGIFKSNFTSYRFYSGSIVIMDDTRIGDTTFTEIKIKNPFSFDILIDSIKSLSENFYIDDLESNIISSMDSINATLGFIPNVIGTFTSNINLYSEIIWARFPISGCSPSPILKTSPTTQLVFGAVNIDTFKTLTFKIYNDNSINDLVIDTIYIKEGIHYHLEDLLFPIVLETNDTTEIAVTFRPTQFGFLKDTLLMFSNSSSSLNEFSLWGVGQGATEVADTVHIPVIYALKQNYPNPFNPATTITYQIPERAIVLLRVYDVLGNEVATLINQEKPAGNYEIEFDTGNLPSGIYFYQLRAGSFVQTKKMLMIK